MVAHRGALFYVAQVMNWDGEVRSPCNSPVACGLWRLQQLGGESGDQKKKWTEVARLEVHEVRRLVGLRYAAFRHHVDFECEDFQRFLPYGIRELLCCSLVKVDVEVEGSYRRLLVLLGFNLDSGDWELVNEVEQPQGRALELVPLPWEMVFKPEQPEARSIMPAMVEFRPDLFLS